MAGEEGADVTLRTHPEEHEIEWPALEHAGQVPGVGGRRGVEIDVLRTHPMHPHRFERDVIEPEPPREIVIGPGIVGRDRALVTPEDVDTWPVDGCMHERRKQRVRRRPTRQCAPEAAVRGDGLARRRLEATHEACGQRHRRIGDHLRVHGAAVTTRGSHA